MIICHCTGTTDKAIAELARNGIDSVADITHLTGAGLCCSPCRDEIARLLVLNTDQASRRRRAS